MVIGKRIYLIIFACFFLILAGIVRADEDIAVTGTVPPKQADFQFEFLITDGKSNASQDETLSYQIKYGAENSAGFTTSSTIVVDYNSTILDYIVGSAGNGYGGATPVVDVNNKTITWSINLPRNTLNQTINFQLKTNSSNISSSATNFTIKAKMSNQYVNMPNKTITQAYQYNSSLVTPTPTSVPAATSTPTKGPTPTGIITPTKTPTPTPKAKAKLVLSGVSFSKISYNSATINFQTNPAAKATLAYGTAANNLGQSIGLSEDTSHSVSIENLSAEKTYYFQISATDPSGQKITSDIFTFKTAEDSSVAPTFENNVVVITSSGNVLLSESKDKDRPGNATALVAADTPYEITYRVRQKISLKSIQAVMKKNIALGIQSQKVLGTSEIITTMIEKEPGVYVARIKTDIAGVFDVFVRMHDTKGNITEEKVAKTKIMPPLSVYDKDTQSPISDSRIFIEYLNPDTKKYEKLTGEKFENIPNPIFTDQNGIARTVLPSGKYRAQVGAFGYDAKEITFTLGANSGDEFPQVVLKKNPANLLNYIRYYSNAITDSYAQFVKNITHLPFPIRFFRLIAVFIVFASIFITYLLFHLRTRVYPKNFISYFLHHFKNIFSKHGSQNFSVRITDGQNGRISQVLVETVDPETDEIINSSVSNKNGVCLISNPKTRKKLKLLITKQGFSPKDITVETDNSREGFTVILEKGENPTHSWLRKTIDMFLETGGIFFEVGLLASLFLELLFFSLFGFIAAIPFFILSLFNIILWIFYQQEKPKI